VRVVVPVIANTIDFQRAFEYQRFLVGLQAFRGARPAGRIAQDQAAGAAFGIARQDTRIEIGSRMRQHSGLERQPLMLNELDMGSHAGPAAKPGNMMVR
jgi:hypothetical protein